jgi:hypothetical protein
MALTFGRLFAPTVVATGTAGTMYTVPVDPDTTIARGVRVRFSNTTAGAISIRVYAVPAAGSPADSNTALPTTSIAANGYLDVQIPVLASGDMLQALASGATSITATCLDGFLQS